MTPQLFSTPTIVFYPNKVFYPHNCFLPQQCFLPPPPPQLFSTPTMLSTPTYSFLIYPVDWDLLLPIAAISFSRSSFTLMVSAYLPVR